MEDQTTPAKTAKPKNIIKDIEKGVESIGAFVGKEAGIIRDLFKKEDPKIQADLIAASKLVQVVKTNLTEKPAIIAYLLRQIDPSFTTDKLIDLLTKAQQALGIIGTEIEADAATGEDRLEQIITWLQSHASQLTNDLAHRNFWTGLFNVIGSILSPGTVWGKIVAFGIYIYQNLIKKI